MKRVVYPAMALIFLLTLACIQCCTVIKDAPAAAHVDPVCKKNVDGSSTCVYEYNGKTYYFDSEKCRDCFKADPDKVLKKK
jgi:YHS domain-containing protein